MINVILKAIISFIITNIDDIIVLMVLFSQANSKKEKRDIVIGQYLGMGVLLIISLMGVYGTRALPERFIRFLGFLPIIIGIRAWFSYNKEKRNSDASGEDEKNYKIGILEVMILAIADGADNIGVYIPVFSKYNIRELVITIGIFMLMVGGWCFMGSKIGGHPIIKSKIQQYKHIIVPGVLIVLGILILFN